MNVKHTKKPETRVDVKYLSSLGIKTYGDNNLYPQTVRDIVDSSPTGRTCVERRSTISRETASHRKRWPKPCATREGIR